ncbi:MAG: hypothetical protein FJ298_07580 [Planctomycetes bacterium]|nr:hypothetical protein [Planctomycetota bacterium]
MTHGRTGVAWRRRGSALLVALIAVMVLAALAAGLSTYSGSLQRENEGDEHASRALYVAEAGLSLAIGSVRGGAVDEQTDELEVGSDEEPLPFSGGGYWYRVRNNHDGTVTVTSTADVGGVRQATEAVLESNDEGIFNSALFAGNVSGDPLYDMKFGGTGVQADIVNGNIYSGRNVLVTGGAQINGLIRAAGSISGGGGDTGKTLPIPDIAGMNYATTAHYNVNALFASATYKTHTALGGRAWQVSESSPAHIFRRNPSDRTSATSSTSKDDYFLEDPYEAVSGSSTVAPANGTRITLAGHDNNPGSNASNKVYYIDGNLWVHNNNIYSFTLFNSGSDPVRATFVVRGNIYISDNILYQNATTGALAMIAIKDPAVASSGNIYFGDPSFGTLERMDSFMYAENNFHDNNLSATGSAKVTVNGNMTAGNQVRINRDWGSQHSKLTVNFDGRIASGAVTLPGLPTAAQGEADWSVVSWRTVAAR